MKALSPEITFFFFLPCEDQTQFLMSQDLTRTYSVGFDYIQVRFS